MIVTPSEDRNAWHLADLLGRSMGAVVETSAAEFPSELHFDAVNLRPSATR